MEKLNNLLENYVKEYEIEDFSELTFISKLVSIVDDHNIEIKDVKTKNKVNINKSFNYSYEFLKTIDERYASHLLKIKEEGVFDIVKNKEECAYSSLTDDGMHYIYLPVQLNIGDTYSITHEMIHDISIDEKNNSLTRHIFCEVPSILSEMLQRDYFRRTTRPKEYNLNSIEILRGLYSKKRTIMLELNLIKTYLKYGYIDKQRFFDLFSNYYEEELGEIVEYFNTIQEQKELNYGFDQRYIIGYLFASYMHDRILNDPKKIKEFIEINDNINEFSISDFLHYLDLEYKNQMILDLKEESYEKLNQSFIKELKRR